MVRAANDNNPAGKAPFFFSDFKPKAKNALAKR